jgi:hypothetical protein
MESISGQDHLDVAMILNSLGNTAKAQGEPTEAHAFFARALEIFCNSLGQDHPYATIAEEHLHALPKTQLHQEIEDDDE